VVPLSAKQGLSTVANMISMLVSTISKGDKAAVCSCLQSLHTVRFSCYDVFLQANRVLDLINEVLSTEGILSLGRKSAHPECFA
jgi:hypothetical protein